MEYRNGRYKVVWLCPDGDEYHSISSYTNGRAHTFTHTRSALQASTQFKNQCAMIDGYAKRQGE